MEGLWIGVVVAVLVWLQAMTMWINSMVHGRRQRRAEEREFWQEGAAYFAEARQWGLIGVPVAMERQEDGQ